MTGPEQRPAAEHSSAAGRRRSRPGTRNQPGSRRPVADRQTGGPQTGRRQIGGRQPGRRSGAGCAVAVLAAALAGGLLWLGPGDGLRTLDEATAGWRHDCTVTVDGRTVGLDRAQARAAVDRALTEGDAYPDAPVGAAALGPTGEEPAAADVEPTPTAEEPAAPEERALPEGVVDAIASARADTALSCRTQESAEGVEEMRETGLTPRTQRVYDEVAQVFGFIPYGGFHPDGVSTGHMPGSTHYEGRAVDWFFRPVSAPELDRGWLLAQWLVANADRLEVQHVIFDDHLWSVGSSAAGWRDYRTPDGASEVTRHRDHVHVDVVRG